MKMFRYLVLLIGVAGFFASCQKDTVDNPAYDFVVSNSADSIYAGERTTFVFSSASADNITIFTGDPGHVYENYPKSKGPLLPHLLVNIITLILREVILP